MMKSIDKVLLLWYIILKEIFKDDTEISARLIYSITARVCCIVLCICLAIRARLFYYRKGAYNGRAYQSTSL